MTTSLIPSVPLNDEELERHLNAIPEVHPLVVHWCMKIYGRKSPRRFRKEYFTGKLLDHNIPKEDQAQFERLQEVELALLQHNMRLCRQLSLRYFNRSKKRYSFLDPDDLLQEACCAVLDCTYGWNGEAKFVTYVYYAISNRLKNYLRKAGLFSAPSQEVINYSIKVSRHVHDHKCSYEEAMEALGVPQLQRGNLLDFYNSFKILSGGTTGSNVDSGKRDNGDLVKSSNTIHNIVVDHRNDEVEGYDPLMFEAFQIAKLTEIEREVFNAHLLGERGCQKRLADELGVSRQAVHAALQRAKEKVRRKYFELAPSEAA